MSKEKKFRWFDKGRDECGEEGMIYSDRLPPEYMIIFGRKGEIELLAEGRDCCVMGMQYEKVIAEPMEFTGIKSEENDIYENDVVNWEFLDGPIKCVVKWCNHRAHFFLEPVNTDYGTHHEFHSNTKLKVIGDTFNNPELLKAA